VFCAGSTGVTAGSKQPVDCGVLCAVTQLERVGQDDLCMCTQQLGSMLRAALLYAYGVCSGTRTVRRCKRIQGWVAG
jgi:hypothetical protein